MKVSIVIPTFNSEKYINCLLNCISLQSYKNLEIIVVDNVSSDNTLEIVKKYKNNLDIKIIVEKDRGQGDAVTKGLMIASGDIHHWHAADDYITEDAIANIVKIFENEQDVDLVFSDGLAFVPDVDRIVSSWSARFLTKNGLLYFFERFQSDTAYWRSSITKKTLPLRLDIPLVVDEEFFYRAVSVCRKIRRSNNELGVFRVRPGQISGSKNGFDVVGFRADIRKNKKIISIEFVRAFFWHTIYLFFRKFDAAHRFLLRCFGVDVYKKHFTYIKNIK